MNQIEPDVVVMPSGETNVSKQGMKCIHGVYIPANSSMQDRAEYCTVCNKSL